jgi:hypothetical protein
VIAVDKDFRDRSRDFDPNSIAFDCKPVTVARESHMIVISVNDNVISMAIVASRDMVSIDDDRTLLVCF